MNIETAYVTMVKPASKKSTRCGSYLMMMPLIWSRSRYLVSSSEKSSNLLPILGAAIKTNQQCTRVTSCGAISIETPSRQKGWHQIIIIISIIRGLASDFHIPMWLWEDITVVGRIIRILQNSASWFRVLPCWTALLISYWWNFDEQQLCIHLSKLWPSIGESLSSLPLEKC